MHSSLQQRAASARPEGPKQPAPRRGPGPGRPTKRQVEERNRELLDAALDLFLQHGFEGTTIRDITQSVGMAKRTVTARYGNKLALFKAALQRAIDDWVLPESRLKAAETDDLAETLVAVARVLVANYLSPVGRRLSLVTNSVAQRLPEISAYTYEQCTQPMIAYLSALLLRHMPERLEQAEADQFALSFLNLVGTPARTILWGVVMSDEEIEARIQHTVRLFLHGLLHRPG